MWPKHADGSDKFYAELSDGEKRQQGLRGALRYAWHEYRALCSERCLMLALKIMPDEMPEKEHLSLALLAYNKSVRRRSPE